MVICDSILQTTSPSVPCGIQFVFLCYLMRRDRSRVEILGKHLPMKSVPCPKHDQGSRDDGNVPCRRVEMVCVLRGLGRFSRQLLVNLRVTQRKVLAWPCLLGTFGIPSSDFSTLHLISPWDRPRFRHQYLCLSCSFSSR